MKKVVIGLMLLGGTTWGYQHQESLHQFALGDYVKVSNQANALAKLREYQVAQHAYRMETDEAFAGRLLDLYEQSGRNGRRPGYISEELARASVQSPNPIPYHGYLFSDLTTHRNGRPVDKHDQYGLAAYPVQPGVSGDVVLLILQDDKIVRPEDRLVEMEGGGVTTGTHTIWARPFKPGDRPPATWPSSDELIRDYKRLDRSVEAGTREARELFLKARHAAAGAERSKEESP